MSDGPVAVHEDEREWERGEESEGVTWRTLLSAGLTPTSDLTLGVARVVPGGRLELHRHEQAEAYFVLEGRGRVTVDGRVREVGPGTAVFLPGSAVHGIEAVGDEELRFAYVFATDAFADVVYDYDVQP